jgi:periplasmic protein TonB
MIALAPEDLADLRRWAICAAVVVLAHGGFAAAMVTWHEDEGGSGPASGIVIEFAPVPLAASTPEAEIPPGPLQDASEASPNKPVETLEEREKVEQKVEAKLEQKVDEKVETKPTEERPPEVAPAPNPDVAVEPPPPQEVKQETAMRQSPSLASIAAAPQVIAEETAAIPVAPVHGQPNPNDSAAAKTWRREIVALIERNKRYPAAAQSRREQGIAHVFFSLDRKGRVIESRIEQSSGVGALDDEALALLRRIQSFPVPPPEFPGEHVTLRLPLRFNLK